MKKNSEKIFHRSLTGLLCLNSMFALAQDNGDSEKKNVTTELSIGVPVLFLTNTTKQGTSSTFSMFGYFLDAAFCPFARMCATLATYANVDIKSGRRAWEGPNIGARYFLLGQTKQFTRASTLMNAESESNLRAYGGVNLSQRDYDFRTVVDSQNDVFVGNRSTLEGSYWNAGLSLGTDYLILERYRMGVALHIQKSISGSSKEMSSSHIYIDVKLLNLFL